MIKLVSISKLFFLVLLVSGCAAPTAFRTNLLSQNEQKDCNFQTAHESSDCSDISPEFSSDGGYELHFVEFDDQGWEQDVRQKQTGRGNSAEMPLTQTDHLMARLRHLLENEKEDLNIILYVHGWKHNAASSDSDVRQLRALLALQSRLERNANVRPRRVVGIYVSWDGKGLDIPEPLSNITFWTRKGAALRVSRGSTIDLFTRFQALQQYYNGPEKSPECNPDKAAGKTSKRCKIRSLMVGHSFGAWILYSALQFPIIESLNANRDIPDGGQRSIMKRPADLVLLINPAFEAVRYEPVHRAAMAHKSKIPLTPILVTVTSTEDEATRFAFPIGRFANSLFEPTATPKEYLAMTRTHGHIGDLLTHYLKYDRHNACPDYEDPPAIGKGDFRGIMEKNIPIEREAVRQFNKSWRDANGHLISGWRRNFCGHTTLQQYGDRYWESERAKSPIGIANVNPFSTNEFEDYSSISTTGAKDPNSPVTNENRDPNSLVWNIKTDESLIKDHNSITHDSFLEFVRQLYDDTQLSDVR